MTKRRMTLSRKKDEMLIKRFGNFYEVVKGIDVISRFKTLEEARTFLANKGISDAKGELDKGAIDLFGDALIVDQNHHLSKKNREIRKKKNN